MAANQTVYDLSELITVLRIELQNKDLEIERLQAQVNRMPHKQEEAEAHQHYADHHSEHNKL